MADFTTTDFGEAGGSPVSPRQPVVDTGPAYAVQFAQDVTKTIFDIAEQKKVGRQNAMMNEFTQETMRLAEATSQGVMRSTEAKSRMRALFSKYSAAAPGMTGELIKLQKDLVTTTGLGRVLEEGSAQEQALVKLEEKAILEGWVDGNERDPNRRQQQLGLYQEYQTAQRMLSDAAALQSYEAGGVNLDAATLNLQNQRAQAQSRRGLAALSAAVTPRFQMDMHKVIQQVQSGQFSQEDAIRQVEVEWANVQANMAAVGVEAGSEQIGVFTRGLQGVYENTLAHLRGETSLTVLENNNKKAIALASKDFLADPQRADIVATSNLLGNSVSLEQIINTNGAVADFIGRMRDTEKTPANVVTSDPEDSQTVGTWMNLLSENMTAAVAGNLSEEGMAELSNNIVNMFKSVDVHGAYSSAPKDYQRVVDFLADPNFGRYTERTGGVPSEVAIPAQDILAQQYQRQVVPMLKKEYEDAVASVTFTKGIPYGGTRMLAPYQKNPVTDVIEPVWSGTGMSFRAKEGSGADMRTTRAALASLNKRVAPQLNKMVRMAAHLEGTRDYKSVYENTYSGVFGVENAVDTPQETASTPAPVQAPQAPRPIPSVGERVNGWEFTGGDPRDRNNWRRTDG